MTTPKILVIGAFGQLGYELVEALEQKYGAGQIVLADIYPKATHLACEELDVVNKPRLIEILQKHGITQIYHLAALLSATGEQQPQLAWEVNMYGLINVLDASIAHNIEKVFWPSSIAVFGPNSPKVNTPQYCIMDPTTIYGITKLAGERLCEYYFNRHGLDVRSLRYPGLIGYKSAPGGGTTDYAVHIYHEALKNKSYTCFLNEKTVLPMMYMPDAIRATLELMDAPAEQVKNRSSYNVAGMSFNPDEIAQSIRKHIPDFKITYNPDFRQKIADNWPQSIDDSDARADWGWKPEYDLDAMTADMLTQIPKLV
jgi:nucleoside-diphosphate-sugar epimerase